MELAATERAREIVSQATQQAVRIVLQAEREAAETMLRAESKGRARGAARLAARALALAGREAMSAQKQQSQWVDLARVLAERVLGEQLRLAPETVVALAKQVVAEARGTSEVRLVAHPDDVPLLERGLAQLEGGRRAVELVPDPHRSRGEVRLESDIGTLDGELAPQLDRLVAELREVFARD